MSHYACETVALLQHESPDFIFSDQWPPNSLDLNPVDYSILGLMHVYKTLVRGHQRPEAARH